VTTNVFESDPWATDSGPANPWDSTWEPTVEADPAVDEKKETTAVTNISVEDPIIMTFKQSGGYEAPWVVLRATTVEEAKELALRASQEGLFDYVAKAAASFAATKGGAQAPRQQAPAQTYQAAPQQSAPQGDGRTCAHGPMLYKEGYNQQKGKAWKGYFCPTPKGTPDQCRAVFVS
jgi:hypothetical protein